MAIMKRKNKCLNIFCRYSINIYIDHYSAKKYIHLSACKKKLSMFIRYFAIREKARTLDYTPLQMFPISNTMSSFFSISWNRIENSSAQFRLDSCWFCNKYQIDSHTNVIDNNTSILFFSLFVSVLSF